MSLKSDVKSACDILRRDGGTSSVNDYMEQLSWMLFLKIFEGIEKEREEIAIASGEEYMPIIENKYRWSNWAEKDWIGKPKSCLKEFVDDVNSILKSLGEQKDKSIVHFIDHVLFPYLESLKGSPEREKIAQIFSEISGNKVRSPYNLLDVIEKLNNIDVSSYEDSHVLSQYYEELLQNMGSEAGWSGEYYTPRPIIRFIVKLIKPKVGKTILDPFAGSGGFLIEAYKHIKKQLGDDLTKPKHEKLQHETFYAQEKKPLPYLIGNMNMILHGIKTPNFARTNTLMEDVHNVDDTNKYDIILTNPPFGGNENNVVQSNFPYPLASTEALALQYVMRKIRKGGKVGMVLPEGQVMFGTGKFMEIRKELLEKLNVFAIVSLPQGVFSSMGAGVKTNLLFFEKTGEPTEEIWYYELEGKFTKTKLVQDKHFKDALEKFEKKELSDNSWVVSIEDIKERDYDLIPKNPNKKEEFEFTEPKELVEDIETINYEINKLVDELKESL